ncbi:hypothetical protein SAMN05216436_10431 [bacterium A37T11]|nr:hypothetical protein SAMN05216436_10431 [bacterium A37T11]
MNKYLRSGLLMTIAGIILCMVGYYLKAQEWGIYKIAMIVGVLLFGVGFLTILYSLIRKVERRSLESDRRERSQG